MADAEAVFGQTPWQTVGPFFHYALPWPGGADLARPGQAGEPIAVFGQVFDADGHGVPDAMVELWQADAAGRHDAPDFVGFGRRATDADGAFRFRTIRPGRVPGPGQGSGNQPQAPHIAVGVFGRGLLKRLVTRVYFADEPDNADDPVLALVPPARRRTLIAAREADGFRFDIRLQGDNETVFLDV